MTNQQSVWEQVYRSGYDQTDPTRLLGDLGSRLTQVQSGLNLKADINSPTLTGTPQAPTPPAPETQSQQIANAQWVAQRHTIGVCSYPGAAQSLPNATWTPYTATGTLAYSLGGFALGAGSAGLLVPRGGIYHTNIRGILNVPAAQAIRAIVGYVDGAAGFVAVHTILNSNPAAIADTHFSVSGEMIVGGGASIRPAAYVDVSSIGPILFTVYALTMTRFG